MYRGLSTIPHKDKDDLMRKAEEILKERAMNYSLNSNVPEWQIEKFKEGALPAILIELKIGMVLDTHRTLAGFRVPYLNFGRHIWKASKVQGGKALERVVRASILQQLELGLDREILQEISHLITGKEKKQSIKKKERERDG